VEERGSIGIVSLVGSYGDAIVVFVAMRYGLGGIAHAQEFWIFVVIRALMGR